MEDDNIIKKKKKNYYRQHNNGNKNNYHRSKKKKKNLLLVNKDVEEVRNILVYNEQDIPKEEVVKKEEIPVIKVQEILKEGTPDYEEMDIIPLKREKKKNQTKTKKKLFNKNIFNKNIFNLKYGLGFAVIVFALFGVSYSYFNYTRIDSRQADISSGDMYVKLVENPTSITLTKMYPRTDEEARARNDNYFDFTVNGKNTSETKALLYTINVNNGQAVSGKNRIDPQYVKLDLQEKVNGSYIYIKEGVSLSNFSFTGIVPVNTTSEITKEYRLRIWIGDNVIISDSSPNASYSQSEFNNLFATYNVIVSSEDKALAYNMFSKNADTETVINFGNISSASNGEGLYILPGTESDSYPIYYYRGAVTNNNVIFGDYCWQIVRTTDTGGIKMIYNGEVTGTSEAPTCENTLHADRILPNTSAFNSNYQSLSDVGYMSNIRYEYASVSAASGSIYGKDIEWDGTNYLVIENTAHVASTNTTKDDNHHYTCGTAGTTTCNTVRYYYYNNFYITLSGGDLLEDAIYKMTGNGNETTKLKNAGYNLNANNSTVKGVIDTWFRTNLTNEIDNSKTDYGVYLEDTVYCNDRSFNTTGSSNTYTQSGWNPLEGNLSTYLYFGTNSRFSNSNWFSTTNVPAVKNTGVVPNIACPNKTDRFTVSAGAGNGALTYPVGLLTLDEIIMSGASGNSNTINNTYYLYTGGFYWSMSPQAFQNYLAYEFIAYDNGGLSFGNVDYVLGVRPVISLKLGIEFVTGGNGTPTNPYVVKYN